MNAIEITLDWPPAELSPNARKHWATKAEAARRYRFACFADARIARDRMTEYPLRKPVEAHVVFHYGKGREPDTDNCLASIKAGVDGVCDAGILANDRDIRAWHVSVERGVKRQVFLVLREVPE